MNINSSMIAPSPTFSQSPPTSKKADNLGDQFMTLLTEQVKNQDPTDPLKPAEQIAQLAQLSSLEQAQSQTETLKDILKALPKTNSPSVAPVSLIGHKIEYHLNNFMIQNGGEVKYKLNQSQILGDSDISVVIRGEDGRQIRTVTIKKDDFDGSFSWDGNDKNGSYVGYKPLTITASQNTNAGERLINLISSSDVKSFNFHTPTIIKLDNNTTINSSDIINVY